MGWDPLILKMSIKGTLERALRGMGPCLRATVDGTLASNT
jgi:hypothetical protein